MVVTGGGIVVSHSPSLLLVVVMKVTVGKGRGKGGTSFLELTKWSERKVPHPSTPQVPQKHPRSRPTSQVPTDTQDP